MQERQSGGMAERLACRLRQAGLSAAALLVLLFADPAHAGLVQLHVRNALTAAPVVSLPVDALKRVGASYQWVARLSTNGSGDAVFNLAGVESGVPYVFVATPYNGGMVLSDDVSAAGSFVFRVGKLPVTVVAGGSNAPLRDTQVALREVLADGTRTLVAAGTTSQDGRVTFDPPGLGSGRRFVLEAPSPWGGGLKRSNPIDAEGSTVFVVGNAPLDVTLSNEWTGQPLAGVEILAGERVGSTTQWIAARTTDAQGRALFDLDGLGSGRRYFLSAVPYNSGRVSSAELSAPGAMTWKVGKLEVTVVGGAARAPLPGLTVYAFEHTTSGGFEARAAGVADASGIVRFDPSGVDSGAEFVFLAQSPVDHSYRLSSYVRGPTRLQFVVGNAPLDVHLVDGVSGDPLAGKQILAYERQAGGQLRFAAAQSTDGAGHAVLDLDRLGDGASYVLAALPYDGGFVLSADVWQPGSFEFRVGTLRVRAVSGDTGEPLPARTIVLQRRNADDTLTFVQSGLTDGAGVVRFDPPALASGVPHVLWTTSPIDGTSKFSEDLTQLGEFVFRVGGAPLTVTAVRGLTGEAIPGIGVNVREVKDTGGEPVLVSRLVTDGDGRVVFDLDGLGSGRRYLLEANPFNDDPVRTAVISEPGSVFLRLATVPVTLIDADRQLPLPGVRINAFEKLPAGGLAWRTYGVTGGDGSVRFDLAGLSDTLSSGPGADGPAPSKAYFFQAYDPFADGKHYYSDAIDGEGAVALRVARGAAAPLDMMPPAVAISTPRDGAPVPDTSFVVRGSAMDNVSVRAVTVTLADGGGIRSSAPASYDAAAGVWTALVDATGLTRGEVYTLTATAADAALNRSSAAVEISVAADTAPPLLVVTSHADGADVASSGFLLAGRATDDVGIAEVTAAISDPVAGITSRRFGVASDGRWTLPVAAVSIAEGSRVEIALTATDVAGKQSSTTIRLDVGAADFALRQLLDRITFGVTPALLLRAQSIGFAGFLAEQLEPLAIDDTALAARLPVNPPSSKQELQTIALLRAIYSERQLLEVLTQFWDNHFSTELNKHDSVAFEAEENERFRANAFGRFRTLLGVSAKSPAMLLFLDQAVSVAAAPNENYARELLELHTMSVTGPYLQQDVEALARIFTGWTVRDGAFLFDPDLHDFSAKRFLGLDFPAGRGIEEGEEVLDIVASHPATASFLCEKLARLFVADAPGADLIGRCAAEFLAQQENPSQMREVVRLLIESPEFRDAASFRAKVKDPLEFVAGLARNLGLQTNGSGLPPALREMGMDLFNNDVPTGFKEDGVEWGTSNQLLMRAKHANRIARGAVTGTAVDLRGFLRAQGQVSAPGAVDLLFEILFAGDASALERQVASDVLSSHGSRPFDIDSASAEQRLRETAATILSFPAYQFQ